MVTPVVRRCAGAGPERSSRIIELVGPAGAGKTTLARVLSERSQQVLPVPLPYYRSVGQTPFFVRNTLLALPTLFSLARQRRAGWLNRREWAWMVILEGWPGALKRQASRGQAVLMLDQGPVFLLAALEAFGPGVLGGSAAQGWWKHIHARWSATLDTVFWLDAPDSVCTDRIRHRQQGHIMKHASEEATCAFLARYRQAFEHAIACLTGASAGPRVFRLDTAAESPHELADRVLSACSLDATGTEAGD